MAERKTIKDTVFIILAWMVAAALVYIVVMKLKILFH
jgi:hypothetical protein